MPAAAAAWSDKDAALRGEAAAHAEYVHLRVEAGVHATQGRRQYMEDRHSVLVHPDFNYEAKLADHKPRCARAPSRLLAPRLR